MELVDSVFKGSSRGLGQEPDVRDEAILAPQPFQSLSGWTNAGNRAAFPADGFE